MGILLAGGTGVIGQALLDQAGHAHNIITVFVCLDYKLKDETQNDEKSF